MDETRLGSPLTLNAQALMLLDHPDNQVQRQRLELFSSPEQFIDRSFAPIQQAEKTENLRSSPQALSVAARLSSDRYEERAKDDALYQALKTLQQRNRSFSSGKVIRAK